MSDRLPAQVDALRLARQGRLLAGQIDLGRMQRLRQYLCSADGQAEVALQFGVDAVGTPFMAGTVEAPLCLVCQRCLESMQQLVTARFALGLVTNEAQTERLANDYEPLIVGDEPIFLSDVIEDELILAMPIVAMHDYDCARTLGIRSETEATAKPEAKENPFAVLKELKSKR